MNNAGVKSSDVSPELAAVPESDLLPLIELLTEAYNDVKYAVIAQLPLEIALFGMGESEGRVEKRYY